MQKELEGTNTNLRLEQEEYIKKLLEVLVNCAEMAASEQIVRINYEYF